MVILLLLAEAADPFVGIVFVILGFVLVFVEIYFMYSDPENMRIGDIYAKTKVLKAQVS